MAPSKMM